MLSQAPNIILIGEIRDGLVAEIAIQAALTGHLVFSTLHTNDAPSAITRLIDMGVKPFLVASSIQALWLSVLSAFVQGTRRLMIIPIPITCGSTSIRRRS
jgi:Tfp pilus assembly pilus retraction ATPase PilT